LCIEETTASAVLDGHPDLVQVYDDKNCSDGNNDK